MPLHLGCSVLEGSGFGCSNEGKRPVQNGKRLTWWISLHCLNCLCQRGTGLVAIFLKNTQLPEGATWVTPQWRRRPEAFIPKEDRSRSWRRKLRASAEVLNGVFWAAQWYAALFPYELMVLVRYVTQLGGMSPPKSWQFGVIIVSLGILTFDEFCTFTSVLGEFRTIDEMFFSNLTVIRSLFSRLFFNILIGACKLHVVQGMNHCMS